MPVTGYGILCYDHALTMMQLTVASGRVMLRNDIALGQHRLQNMMFSYTVQ